MIARAAVDVRVDDLTRGIPGQDVRAGALAPAVDRGDASARLWPSPGAKLRFEGR